MTVRYTADVFCNKCGSWLHYNVGIRPVIRQARKFAKEMGWIVKRGPDGYLIDICPSCQEAL